MRPHSYTNMHVTFMLSYFPNLSTKSLLHNGGRTRLVIMKKIDTKKKIVGVTIPPEQNNRAAERCHIAARARKRAGTKMQSPALLLLLLLLTYLSLTGRA